MNPPRPVISLLHATRGRPDLALEARERWLKAAAHPERIEHIFGVDCDDEPTRKAVAGLMHHIVPEKGGGCVAAWNLAAKASTGDVLVQLSDDWLPADGWDEEFVRRLRDISMPAVLRVSDGHRRDDLLCIAILTRARLVQQGEFLHHGYFGVYSDDEFSFRAYLDGVVIDARDLVLTHRHPHFDASVAHDETYANQNSSERSREGRELFLERNPEALGHWLHEGAWERFFIPLAGHYSQPVAEQKNALESGPGSSQMERKALRKAEILFLEKNEHVNLFQATALQTRDLLASVRKSPFGKMALKKERMASFGKCLEGAKRRWKKHQMLEACGSFLQATRLGLALLSELERHRFIKSKVLSAAINGLRQQHRGQRKWLQKLKHWMKQLPESRDSWGVDREHYMEQSGKLFSNAARAALHYDKEGWKKELNPHSLFDTKYFRGQNAGRIDPEANPLEEYHRLVDEGEAPEANSRFPAPWLRDFFRDTFDQEPKIPAEIPEAPAHSEAAQEFSKLKPVLTAGLLLSNVGEEGLKRFLAAFAVASQRAVEAGHSQAALLAADASGAWNAERIQTLSKSAGVEVLFMPSGKEAGFARLQNELMRAAFGGGATHYACLDVESLLHPDALLELLKRVQMSGMPALVEARQFPSEDPKDYDAATGETHWCSERFLVIPRFLFELTGGFDEALPKHATVIDLGWRVWQNGYRCLMASLALVHCAAVDASPGAPREKLLLESGRVLAEKWQCPKFRAQCERLLVEHGHLRSISDLSPLPPLVHQAPHRRVDFANELAFSPARW
jgi:hypothetical protein